MWERVFICELNNWKKAHIGAFITLHIWAAGQFTLSLDHWHDCLVLALDEECVQQGIEFVPARLKQKKPKDNREEVSRGRASKHGSNMWEPSSSDEDYSDSGDSMSDLYPRQYPKCTHCRRLCPLLIRNVWLCVTEVQESAGYNSRQKVVNWLINNHAVYQKNG